MPGLGLGRDPARTPMQWDSGHNAGFTRAAKPWLPIAEDYKSFNVEREAKDPSSFLQFHKQLLQLRRQHAALCVGDFIPVQGDERLIAYKRHHDKEQFLVVLNFTNEKACFDHPEAGRGKVVLSTHAERQGSLFDGSVALEANEAMIIELNT